MATTIHTFLPLYNLTFTSVTQQPYFRHLRYRHRHILLSAVTASSSPNIKTRKPVRTNEDVCNDLRTFMLEVGMPDGCVPSLKELTHHGRQDLANIVRRRGYKLIRELLAASQETKVTDFEVDGSLTDDKAIDKEDESTEPLNDNENDFSVDVLLSHEDSNMEETSITKASEDDTENDVESSFVVDDSTKLSLQEKVVQFIQSGELETFEDDALDIVNVNKNIGSQNSSETELSSVSEEQSGQLLSVSESENGSILTSTLVNSTSHLRNITSADQLASAESANTDSNVDFETRTKEDQAEINRIKVMLHHKELELTQLREQIEKNKQALSELQDKAETEITRAQQLLLDKDAELLAAEESLSGLKQVELEYWGDGESVEVAGSFNGWHHGVKLDPQPSSNITDPDELRNPKLWKSMLWLYPGIYEIKFIVDGKWVTDPMKEVVYRGSIHNNVLRVDR